MAGKALAALHRFAETKKTEAKIDFKKFSGVIEESKHEKMVEICDGLNIDADELMDKLADVCIEEFYADAKAELKRREKEDEGTE